MSLSAAAADTHWRLPLILLILGGALSAVLTYAVLAGNSRLLDLNNGVYQALQAHRSPGWDTVMRTITAIGDAAVTVPVALAALAWMLRLRAWRTAGYWALATALGTALVGLIKNLTQVARPQDLYSGLSSFSFPSGHSSMSVVVYGLLAFFISRGWSAGRRWLLLAVTALLIAAIGFSRLYLGAHWFSDVCGGVAMGLAWTSVLVLGWRHNNHHSGELAGLLPLVLTVLLLATAWHVYAGGDAARARYQQAGVVGQQAIISCRPALPGADSIA